MPTPRRPDGSPSLHRYQLDKVSSVNELDTVHRSPLVSNEDLQAFIVESEQSLQDFTMEFQFRHREFVHTLVENIANQLRPATLTREEADPPVSPAAKVPNSPTLREASNVDLSTTLEPAQTEQDFKEAIAEVPKSPTLREASNFYLSTTLKPAQTEKDFKEAIAEVLPIQKIKECVASVLLPMRRDLKCMQASMDRLEKPSASQSYFSDPTKRNLGHGPGQVHPWEALRQATTNHQTRTPHAAAASIGLAHAKSNLHFAADMLDRFNSFSPDEVNNLLKEMDNCELPNVVQQDSCCKQLEPERTGGLARILRSNEFQRAIALVILLNAVFIHYSVNYAVSHPQKISNEFISILEVFFNIVYLIEIALRLTVHRLYFFINKDFMWNNFDIFLVCGSFYDLIMKLRRPSLDEESASFGMTNGFSLEVFRILRLLRIAKVIRVFRVMLVFRELNVLIKVVTSTLRPLFSGSFVLAIFYYMFAVVFTHGTSSYLSQPEAEPDAELQLLDQFGSVSLSMNSLYKATTGGADWGNVADAVSPCGSFYYGLFLFFIAFVTLALLNIITGLFVDRAMRSIDEDRDLMAVQKLHSDRAVVKDLCKIFGAMSGEELDEDARIDQELFQKFMNSPVMRARLAVLDLEIWDSARFFKTLTAISQTSEINLATFVAGCMQLRGHAKRVDLQALNEDVRSVKRHVKAAEYFQHELGRQILGGGPSLSMPFADGSDFVAYDMEQGFRPSSHSY